MVSSLQCILSFYNTRWHTCWSWRHFNILYKRMLRNRYP